MIRFLFDAHRYTGKSRASLSYLVSPSKNGSLSRKSALIRAPIEGNFLQFIKSAGSAPFILPFIPLTGIIIERYKPNTAAAEDASCHGKTHSLCGAAMYLRDGNGACVFRARLSSAHFYRSKQNLQITSNQTVRSGVYIVNQAFKGELP